MRYLFLYINMPELQTGKRRKVRKFPNLWRPRWTLHVHIDRRGAADVHMNWTGTWPCFHCFSLWNGKCLGLQTHKLVTHKFNIEGFWHGTPEKWWKDLSIYTPSASLIFYWKWSSKGCKYNNIKEYKNIIINYNYYIITWFCFSILLLIFIQFWNIFKSWSNLLFYRIFWPKLNWNWVNSFRRSRCDRTSLYIYFFILYLLLFIMDSFKILNHMNNKCPTRPLMNEVDVEYLAHKYVDAFW